MNHANQTGKTPLTAHKPLLTEGMTVECWAMLQELSLYQFRALTWILANEEQRSVSSHPESDEMEGFSRGEAKSLVEELRLEEMGLINLAPDLYWTLTEKGLLAISFWMHLIHQDIQEALERTKSQY